MTKITISMPEAMNDYVSERVAKGQYGNVSEYFRDLVRKEQAEQRLTTDELRELLKRAEASGVSRNSIPDIMKQVERKLRSDGRL
jgi:antitoxin ParD1/3/4